MFDKVCVEENMGIVANKSDFRTSSAFLVEPKAV